MYRQSPSRTQRSKGFKVKHVLQICLLLAVCFWLIYQVKHSHDKRKEYSESDGRSVLQRESGDGLIRLGRKDVQSRLEGAISKIGKHEEPEEEEEVAGGEVEENKSEDELEDKKVKGKEDELVGSEEDGEIDEHEQEKSHEDGDREEDMVDEEKEREEVENETHETYSEDGHDQLDKEISTEEGDHDGDDGSVDEAREEHYKADDASSAVTHDAQIATSENEKEGLENSTENPRGILEEENKDNNRGGETSDGEKLEGGGEVGKYDHQSNMTNDDLDSGSSTNNTKAEGVDAHLTNNSTPETTTEDHGLRSENEIENKPELNLNSEIRINSTSADGFDLNTNASNPVDISVLNADSRHADFNATGSSEPKDGESHSEEFSNSSNNTYNTESSGASENIIISKGSAEAVNNGSLPQGNAEINAVNADINGGAEGILESATESHVDDLHDAIDISDTSNFAEEKEVHIHLDTIPEIQTEGTYSKDVAAE